MPGIVVRACRNGFQVLPERDGAAMHSRRCQAFGRSGKRVLTRKPGPQIIVKGQTHAGVQTSHGCPPQGCERRLCHARRVEPSRPLGKGRKVTSWHHEINVTYDVYLKSIICSVVPASRAKLLASSGATVAVLSRPCGKSVRGKGCSVLRSPAGPWQKCMVTLISSTPWIVTSESTEPRNRKLPRISGRPCRYIPQYQRLAAVLNARSSLKSGFARRLDRPKNRICRTRILPVE